MPTALLTIKVPQIGPQQVMQIAQVVEASCCDPESYQALLQVRLTVLHVHDQDAALPWDLQSSELCRTHADLQAESEGEQ